MKRPIVYWGATGQSRVLREFSSDAGFQLVALFDNDPETDSPFADVPLYHGKAGFRSWLARTGKRPAYFLVAIGGDGGRDRLALHRYLAGHGLEPATVVHPTAFVAKTASVGPGSQILAQAAVCAGARVGMECIINTSASVDHDCTIGDGAHVGPGVTIAGQVNVGPRAFIGVGAVVLPNLRIGADAIVGAGAVVTADVAHGQVVIGNPAKPRAVKSPGVTGT